MLGHVTSQNPMQDQVYLNPITCVKFHDSRARATIRNIGHKNVAKKKKKKKKKKRNNKQNNSKGFPLGRGNPINATKRIVVMSC